MLSNDNLVLLCNNYNKWRTPIKNCYEKYIYGKDNYVLTLNPETLKIEFNKLLNVFKEKNNTVYMLIFNDERKIVCDEHTKLLMYDKEDKRAYYKEIFDIIDNDYSVISVDYNDPNNPSLILIKVVKIKKIGNDDTYAFKVKNTNNFLAGHEGYVICK